MSEHFYYDSNGSLKFRLDAGSMPSQTQQSSGDAVIPTLHLDSKADVGDQTLYSSGLNLVDIYKNNKDSVIRIKNHQTAEQGSGTLAASGFFLTPDGIAATDLHAVDGSDTLTVTTEGGLAHRATVLKLDPATDSALIKVEPAYSGETFSVPRFGSSQSLRPNDEVVALSHPQGWSPLFLSDGSLTYRSTMGHEAPDIDGRLQPGEDANRPILRSAIHLEPGSSGGPVFDGAGNVIGMVDTAGSGRSETTPIEDVLQLLNRTRSLGSLASRLDSGTPPSLTTVNSVPNLQFSTPVRQESLSNTSKAEDSTWSIWKMIRSVEDAGTNFINEVEDTFRTWTHQLVG